MAAKIICSAAVVLNALGAIAAPVSNSSSPIFSTTCNGKSYSYDKLAGYGFVPSDARDKYGDTISLGSSISIKSWKKTGCGYEGILWGLPDRGWNTEGTINYIPRVHKFSIKLTPKGTATAVNPASPNLQLEYLDTVLFSGPDGTYCTGLDPDQSGGLEYPGFPVLPTATYEGDGFGGEGPGGKAISVDSEGITIADDGSFWVSDEYGPYVYHFSSSGLMTAAIRPPDAILPLRQGEVSFSADSPPRYDPDLEPTPVDPTQGRQNNQGFEGLTMSPDGKSLYVLLQSAARQEGGSSSSTRIPVRFLKYDLGGDDGCPADDATPVYAGEWVVPLPTFTNAAGKTRIAAQSEVHFISDSQFLFLPRDSSVGRGQDDSTSVYRHIDIFDISSATDIMGTSHDAFNASIANSKGVINSDVAPATVCPFIDFNINSELNRFGLHNGGDQDAGLLNEKWESIALVPVDGQDGANDEYLLFSASDNDFITQNGYMNGGKLQYQDASGFSLDHQVLVFKVTLPKGSKPLVA